MRAKRHGRDTQRMMESAERTDIAAESALRKVKFEIAAEPGSDVAVAGSFNNWDPAANRMKLNGHGTFVTNVKLPVGRHEYKFVINGVWQADPNCPNWVPNSYGSLNSVAEVA